MCILTIRYICSAFELFLIKKNNSSSLRSSVFMSELSLSDSSSHSYTEEDYLSLKEDYRILQALYDEQYSLSSELFELLQKVNKKLYEVLQ